MYYVGIDPGMTGGVAILQEGAAPVTYHADVYVAKAAGPKGKRNYAPVAMANCLRPLLGHPALVCLEQVWSRPGEAPSAAFRFGEGYGVWLGILGAFKLPYQLLPPRLWQKLVLGGSRPPAARRLAALALYPDAAAALCRQKDEGVADALLLAVAGRILNSGSK